MEAAETRLDTLQRVELLDGVEVQLRIAGPFLRGRAWLIDLGLKVVMIILFSIIVYLTFGSVDAGIAGGLIKLGSFGIMFFYNVIMEASEKGSTFGKRWSGLKVVTLGGGKITFGQSMVRNLLRMADMNPILPLGLFVFPSFAVGLVCALFTKRFQRVGDLVAGTLVVHTKEYQAPAMGTFSDETTERPPVNLLRDEQKVLIDYFNRGPGWSDERKVELSDHLSGLTGVKGIEGARRTVRMGRWLKFGDKEGRK